jgi:septum formation topological specificity factor MinE
MTFDPASISLDALFVDPDMFDSRRAWRRAGFEVLDPAKDTECMVAAHPSTPGYLFKKYGNDVSPKEQSKNYAARIEGAAQLAKFITAERLAHVVVPQKHLHELPKKFRSHDRPTYILVVERLNILGKDESARRYHDIAEPVLRELLSVLVRYKGLDSNSKNVQFTRDGKIAFVDLENWGRKDRDEVRLKSIGNYLSKERLKLARKILDELE